MRKVTKGRGDHVEDARGACSDVHGEVDVGEDRSQPAAKEVPYRVHVDPLLGNSCEDSLDVPPLEKVWVGEGGRGLVTGPGDLKARASWADFEPVLAVARM